MQDPIRFWEQRYEDTVYTYGTKPNRYFQQQLEAFDKPGRLLLLAEGEGRNAVYAAAQGWQVTAVDFSENARKKALALAKEEGVLFEYLLTDIQQFDFSAYGNWDVIGLVYAHFPPDWRSAIHQKCADALAPGGHIILEAFNPKQLNRQSGGPKNRDWLYTPSMLLQDFESLEPIKCAESTVFLQEGTGHDGLGEVVRGNFRKKM
jgi:SAM-dependent methyltransferase